MVEDLSISGTHKEYQNKIKKLHDYGITLPVSRVSVKPFKEHGSKEVFCSYRSFEKLNNNISYSSSFSYFL
jgi:hypothetical protein